MRYDEIIAQLACFNPSDGLSVFQTSFAYFLPVQRYGFNPSDGLSVFQTISDKTFGVHLIVSIPRMG